MSIRIMVLFGFDAPELRLPKRLQQLLLTGFGIQYCLYPIKLKRLNPDSAVERFAPRSFFNWEIPG
jgi:hypothetical protein